MIITFLYSLYLIDFWRRCSQKGWDIGIAEYHEYYALASLFFVRRSCQRLHLHLPLDDLQINQPKLNGSDEKLHVVDKLVNCRLMDIITTLDTGDTFFGRARLQPKQIRRVKMPSLLAVEIRTEILIRRIRQRIRCYWRWWLHHLLAQVDVSSTKVCILTHQNA